MGIQGDPLEALISGQTKLWMISTGINDYEDVNLSPLRYATSDCKALIAAFMAATEQFSHRELIVHCHMEHSINLETIRINLQRVAAQASEHDIVLFYWAGHGLVESIGQPLYLCLPETQVDRLAETSLSLAEVLSNLKQCRATRQLMIIDTCHSGSLSCDRRGLSPDREFSGADPLQQTRSAAELKQALEQYAGSQQDFYALLSCDRGQRSWESAQLQHGVFTYFLIEGLRGKAADSRGVITATDLFQYVYNETRWYVGSAKQEQTPCQIIRSVSGELIIGMAERSKTFPELYAEHLNTYEQSFIHALCQGYPLSQDDRQELRRLQQTWRLTDHDIHQREDRIIHACEGCKQDLRTILGTQDLLHLQDGAFQLPRLHRTSGLKLELIASLLRTVIQEGEQQHRQYETEAFTIIHQHHPHHEAMLQPVQKKLGLTPVNVATSTARLVAEYEAIVADYQREISYEVSQHASVDEISLDNSLIADTSVNVARTIAKDHPIYRQLQQIGRRHGLRDDVTAPIIDLILGEYQAKLDQYWQQASYIIQHHHPSNAKVDQLLKTIQGDLQDQVVAVINQRLRIDHQQRVDHYKQRISALLNQQYPFDHTALMDSFQPIARAEQLTKEVAEEINDRMITYHTDITNQYQTAVLLAVHADYPLNDVAYRYLRRQRDNLGLTQEVAAAIEDNVCLAYEQKESCYQAAIYSYAQQQYPLSDHAQTELKQLQQELGLQDTAAKRLQQQINHTHEQAVGYYRDTFIQLISRQYPLILSDRQQLQTLQNRFSLRSDLISLIERSILESYEPKLGQYQRTFAEFLHQDYPLEMTQTHNQQLKDLQSKLELSDEITATLRSQAWQAYEEKIHTYEQLATALIQKNYPFDELAQQQLQAKQTVLKLNGKVVGLIHDRVYETYQQRLQAYEQQLRELLNP